MTRILMYVWDVNDFANVPARRMTHAYASKGFVTRRFDKISQTKQLRQGLEARS